MELKIKHKQDVFCLIIAIILCVISLFIKGYEFLGFVALFSFIVVSFTIEKDFRRIKNKENPEKGLIINLLINIFLYAICFIVGVLLYLLVGLAVAAITIIMYRNVYYARLSKMKT